MKQLADTFNVKIQLDLCAKFFYLSCEVFKKIIEI